MKNPALRFVPAALAPLLAFGLGYVLGHAPSARAATALQPAVVDVSAIVPGDLNPPNPITPNNRTKTYAAADGAAVQVQIGTVPRHYHSDANEIQVVMSGSGTEWLGDKQVALRPGTMLIIPAGTPHGGTTDPNLKIVAVKTPPQAPTDIHLVP